MNEMSPGGLPDPQGLLRSFHALFVQAFPRAGPLYG